MHRGSSEVAELRQQIAALTRQVDAQNQLIAELTCRMDHFECQNTQKESSVALPSTTKAPAITGRTLSAAPRQTSSYGGGGQPCARCGQIVYAAEQITARGNIMHRDCFRCAHCDGKLVNSPNWEVLNGSFYCGPHFQQRIIRGVAAEKELSAAELQAIIEKKLHDAEAAFELEEMRIARRSLSAQVAHVGSDGSHTEPPKNHQRQYRD